MIRLVDINGNTAASYRYDPYGKAISALGSHATINPLRYRGYVFDHETGLYYLQSRYYDPEIGRFINADALVSTGQGLLGNNMFAYCLNTPVNGSDPCGTCYHSEVFWIDCEQCKRIQHDVPLYNQGDDQLCWAYCQVMIESYNEGKSLTQEEADKQVKKTAIKAYGRHDWNRPGHPEKAVEIEINSIQELYSALEKYGPLYAAYNFYDKDGKSLFGHAVVVTGVNLWTNTVYTNNPSSIQGKQTYDEFILVYTGGTAIDWRLRYFYLEGGDP